MESCQGKQQEVHGLRGEEIPHKCDGIKSSQIGNNDFYDNKEEGNIHSCQNGKPRMAALSYLMKIGKGTKKIRISHHKQSNLRLPVVLQDHNYCRVSTRGGECRSRQRIHGFRRFK